MRIRNFFAAAALVLGLALPGRAADITFQTIDFQAIGLGNSRLTDNGSFLDFPYGSPSLFGGVPFIINDIPNQTWAAAQATGGNQAFPSTVQQTFPMAVNNIYAFYTLANTWWGSPNATVTTYRFTFSDNTTYDHQLTNGVDIRDFNIGSNDWAITINGTTTRNVYLNPETQGSAVDRQFISFPAEHQGKNLVSFTVIDQGGWEYSRIFLSAATAQVGGGGQVVPEPSTYILGGLATGVMGVLARRRKAKRLG